MRVLSFAVAVALAAVASAKVEFVVPNKDTVWYVGNGVNESPIQMTESDGSFSTGYTYKLSLLQESNTRVHVMDLDAEQLNKNQGSLEAYDFEGDYPVDNDESRVKLESVGELANPDLGRSVKFTVYRIGAQPYVPEEYRYVADILKPSLNQKLSAGSSSLPVEIQMGEDVPNGHKLELVLKDAVSGKEVGEPKTIVGTDLDDALGVLTTQIPLEDIEEGRYFMEVHTRMGGFRRSRNIFRSAPFFIGEGKTVDTDTDRE